MTQRLLNVAICFTAHHVFAGFSAVIHAWLCLRTQSPGYVLISMDTKVRKTITYPGTKLKKVERLLICSISVFILVSLREDFLFYFILFGTVVSLNLATSLHVEDTNTGSTDATLDIFLFLNLKWLHSFKFMLNFCILLRLSLCLQFLPK